MAKKDDFFAGQELYLVSRDARDSKQMATVLEIGRKYVTLSDGHCIELDDKSAMTKQWYSLKKYGIRGNFYFSKKEYEDFLFTLKLNKKIVEVVKENKEMVLAMDIADMLNIPR